MKHIEKLLLGTQHAKGSDFSTHTRIVTLYCSKSLLKKVREGASSPANLYLHMLTRVGIKNKQKKRF